MSQLFSIYQLVKKRTMMYANTYFVFKNKSKFLILNFICIYVFSLSKKG